MAALKEILPLKLRRLLGGIYDAFIVILKFFLFPSQYNRYCFLELIQRLIYSGFPLDDDGRNLFEDSVFNQAYDSVRELDSPRNLYRRYNLFQLTKLVQHLSGDTAECGIYKGVSSLLICKSLLNENRIHYGFDSFAGLSQPKAIDGEYWTKGDLSTGMEAAQLTLKDFRDRVVMEKGWIPERFFQVESKRFCFVHLDVDLYQPTLDSLSFFYDRMVVGGIIICDDSGFKTCPGAKKAWDEFFVDKIEPVVELSAGQSFIVKR